MGRKKLRENTRRRSPWNASKADAKRFAVERELKNRIAELESERKLTIATVNNLIDARNNLRRMLDAVCDPKQVANLRLLGQVSIKEARRLGLVEALVRVELWRELLEGGVIANMEIALADADKEFADNTAPVVRTLGTIPNAEPLLPHPSGVTMQQQDPDDETSIDNLFAKACDVHLERMDKHFYWLGITPVGGDTIHIDIAMDKNQKGKPMRARRRT
jgi:hypothetical protein